TMDMHAQVQEHQEGRLNKVVQFIKVRDWNTSLVVPNLYSEYDKLDAIGDIPISDILNSALDANREALSIDNRFNMTISVPTLNAFHLGEIMFMHCWAVYFESILAGVDAFDQPGVEVYKRLIGPKLQAMKKQ
ncbi:MAG: glucose-6-phosphate isomerase, partial [Veillonella sp.]|nr:glucose-6-phosphate isomerase [Veillonella sp.]